MRKIRAIEMFANESIMTALMVITRVYRENNAARYVCKHSKNQITYGLYICSNRTRAFGRASMLQRLLAVKDFQLEIHIYTARSRNPILILTTIIFTNVQSILLLISSI